MLYCVRRIIEHVGNIQILNIVNQIFGVIYLSCLFSQKQAKFNFKLLFNEVSNKASDPFWRTSFVLLPQWVHFVRK